MSENKNKNVSNEVFNENFKLIITIISDNNNDKLGEGKGLLNCYHKNHKEGFGAYDPVFGLIGIFVDTK